MDYENGMYLKTDLTMTAGERTYLDFKTEGNYKTAVETIYIDMIHREKAPFWVTVDGNQLEHFLHRRKFEEAESGWYYSQRLKSVQIKYRNPKKDYQVLVSFEQFDLIGMEYGRLTIMKKYASLFLAALLSVLCLSGCGQKGAAGSEQATKENPMILTLAHGLSESHTVHIAMMEFAQQVEEQTEGRIKVKIFPNGQLGSENENMEQLMAGVVAMTKVSAPGLATYNESYHTFGLPYIFDGTEDFYHIMDSRQMEDFFLSSEDDGFVTLTYYTSGARSFYTKNKAIRTPADLKGLKIRVQDMKSQTDMLNALGGIPVAMSYGDVYTSLQTGIIDGTENNETALTTGKHGEVCKVFSTDQHAMIPDVMVMSAKIWETISPQDQQIILDAAHASTDSHKIAWDAAIEEAVTEASGQMNVEFVDDVDKEAFREATSGMIEEYCEEYPGVQKLLDIINSVE